mgnify:CR=1 FL=1|jgi:hypothetical protein
MGFIMQIYDLKKRQKNIKSKKRRKIFVKIKMNLI